MLRTIAEEVDLVRRFLNKDSDAIQTFWEEYHGCIAALAFKAGGALAREALDGFVSDLLLNDRYLRSYKGQARLCVWLKKVVRTAWIDWCRARQRDAAGLKALQAVAREDEVDPHRDRAGPADAPGEDGRDELRALLERAVCRSLEVLTPEEARLIGAIFFRGISQVDYAGRVGLTRFTINRRLHAALRRCKARFDELVRDAGRADALLEELEWLMSLHPADREAFTRAMVAALERRMADPDELGPGRRED